MSNKVAEIISESIFRKVASPKTNEQQPEKYNTSFKNKPENFRGKKVAENNRKQCFRKALRK